MVFNIIRMKGKYACDKPFVIYIVEFSIVMNEGGCGRGKHNFKVPAVTR